MSAASIATATPIASAGNTGPPRKPAPSESAYASPFAATSSNSTDAEPSAMTSGISACPEKRTRSTGRSAAARKTTASTPTRAPATTSASSGRRLAASVDAVGEMPDADHEHGDDDGQDDAPRPGRPAARCRRRAATAATVGLVQPLPVLHAREDERAGAGGDEAGQESPHDHRRGDCTAHRDELEQHDRRHERAAEQHRDRSERSREHEQLSFRLLHADEPYRDRSQPEAEGDERRLRPEHEPEAEGRESRQQDAGQLDRAESAPC